ncbi:synaptotagmin-7-like [Tubulanus polymorphus]|uniref:synaptotagmin-7-like n=1 Tax=Tubulanus polymorphus TaxID=672921 RepID=UPI003DA675B6
MIVSVIWKCCCRIFCYDNQSKGDTAAAAAASDDAGYEPGDPDGSRRPTIIITEPVIQLLQKPLVTRSQDSFLDYESCDEMNADRRRSLTDLQRMSTMCRSVDRLTLSTRHQPRRGSFDSFSISLEELDKGLYLSDSSYDEETATVNAACSRKVHGRLCFSVEPRNARKSLLVRINRAENLRSKYRKKSSETTFLKLTILPNKDTKFTSKNYRNADPVFNEEFLFTNLSADYRTETKLLITVCEYDRFSRDSIKGHVLLPLKTISDDSSIADEMWMDLQESLPSDLDEGQLYISLAYDPLFKKLTVGILRGQDLYIPNVWEKDSTVGVFVRVCFMFSDEIVKTRKTRIIRKQTNPEYNESFVFDVNPATSHNMKLIFTACAKSKLRKSRPLGQIVIGPRGADSGLMHWQKAMVSSPMTKISYWHTLTTHRF